MRRYPRNMQGYGGRPPAADWPGGARIAVQFVLNYEEGAENCVLHGDPASETFLSEIVGAQAYPMRHLSIESLYEYGSRAGVWRLLRLFRERSMPLTVFVTDAKREKISNEKVKVDVQVSLDKPIGYFSMVRTISFAVPEGTRPGEFEIHVGFDRNVPGAG